MKEKYEVRNDAQKLNCMLILSMLFYFSFDGGSISVPCLLSFLKKKVFES